MTKIVGLPSPPGGRLVCEKGQTAIVKRDRQTNEIVAQCVTDPTFGSPKVPNKIPDMLVERAQDGTPRVRNPAASNDLLSRIYGLDRASTDAINSKEATMLLEGYGRIYDQKTGHEIEVWLSPQNDDDGYFAEDEIEKVQEQSIFSMHRGFYPETSKSDSKTKIFEPFDYGHEFKPNDPHGSVGPIIMVLPDEFMNPELKIMNVLKKDED